MYPGAQDPIRFEFTPNPNTLKYVVHKQLLPRGTASFTEPGGAAGAPLPRRLFDVPGVTGVMVAPTFVTVTLDPSADAAALNDQVHERLHAHLDSGEAAVPDELLEQARASQDDSEAVRRIRTIIEEEVRPAVAMDGGDITFERFHEGTVYVWMKGACSSCPSSTATLKSGIETRLREEVPEVVSVVQV